MVPGTRPVMGKVLRWVSLPGTQGTGGPSGLTPTAAGSFAQLELVLTPNASKTIRNRNISEREVWQPSCAETRCRSSELSLTRVTRVAAPLCLWVRERLPPNQKSALGPIFSCGCSGLHGYGPVQAAVLCCRAALLQDACSRQRYVSQGMLSHVWSWVKCRAKVTWRWCGCKAKYSLGIYSGFVVFLITWKIQTQSWSLLNSETAEKIRGGKKYHFLLFCVSS